MKKHIRGASTSIKDDAQKRVTKPHLSESTTKDSVMIVFFEKNGFYLFLFSILFLSFLIFKDFLFFKKVYLFKDIGSDTINFYLPNWINVSEHFREFGIPTWSFKQGMGQDVFGLSLADPFNWIYYLLGKDKIASAIIYVELLKLLLTGVFFYGFLTLHKIAGYIKVIFSLLLSFSGFMIVGGSWYVFSTEGVFFAGLLFALENYFKNKQWIPLAILFAFIGLNQPFNLFLGGLLVGFYFVFKFLNSTATLKELSIDFLKVSGVSILGALTTVFVWYSLLVQALNSPRVSGEASFFETLIDKGIFSTEETPHNISVIFRLLSNDLLGNGSNYIGWYNYLEAPLLYCGLLTLFTFPVAFSSTDKTKLKSFSVIILLVIIPLVLPFFRNAFWLFSGDYYRIFSLFVIFALMSLSIIGIQEIFTNKSKKVIILLTSSYLFLLFLLYNPFVPENITIDPSIKKSVFVILTVYYVFTILLRIEKFRNIASILLFAAVLFEIYSFNYDTVKKREVLTKFDLSQKKGYNDYTVEGVNYLKNFDTSFYRIEKNYSSGMAVHQSTNDAKVFGYNGTPSYHSFNQKYYITFLSKMDIINPKIESQTRWSIGLSYRPLLQILGSVKYKFSKSDDPNSVGYGYNKIQQTGDVHIFKNIYYLPLGFCYENVLNETQLIAHTPIKRDISMLKAVTLENNSSLFNDFSMIDTASYSLDYSFDNLEQDLSVLRNDSLKINSFKEDEIIGNISLNRKKILFFSIPYDPSWKAFINQSETPIHIANIGFMSIVVPEGNHEIKLKFTPPLFYQLLIVSMISTILIGALYVYQKIKLKKTEE
jgi:uncharacterized membrane protein YfhO